MDQRQVKQSSIFSRSISSRRTIGGTCRARFGVSVPLLLIAALYWAGHHPAHAAAPESVSPSAKSNSANANSGNSSGNGNGAGNGSKPKFADGHILVAREPNATSAEFAAALAGNNGRSLGKLGGLDVDVVDVPVGREEETAARLAKHPKIKFAEVDKLMPPAGSANDPNFASEWHLTTIGAPAAWDYGTGSGVTIAIIDSGVDSSHPDLAPQLVPGWNFYDNNINTADVYGHGTAVAGAAAAATNNGMGVASVAGGARIMPLRVSDSTGYTFWSTAAQAINYAADHGVRVANLSFVGPAASSTIQTAASYLRSKGGVLFVSAGNSGTQDNTTPTSVMTVVSATDTNDQIASFSTYGSFVTLAAPGNYILTTSQGGIYQYWWGTSFAAPIAAATAALILSRRPDLTPSQVDSTIASTATDLGAPGKDIYYGAGRINAAAALQAAAGSSPTQDTTPPNVAITSPTGGTVSAVVSVAVNASDNIGVTRVDLRLNGLTVATMSAPPYLFTWNSATVADGSAALSAVAYDAAGNSKTSAPVAVNVSNAPVAPPSDTTPPTVSIASPTGGTVSGSIGVSVSASDNVAVTRVDLRVNGATVASTNAAPYQFSWNSATAADGMVSMTAVAFDAAGNSTTSSAVSLNVQNASSGLPDTTPPTLAITNPANGTNVSGTAIIRASASDNSGAAGITQKLYIDGALKVTATGGALTYNWNTRKTPLGGHTIVVTATDASGNATTAQVQVQITHK